MAYWGTGIFESDYALCTLGELLAPMGKKMEDCLLHERLVEWDAVEADHVAIGMKIIMTLDDEGISIESPPAVGLAKEKLQNFKLGWEKNCKRSCEDKENYEFQMERLKELVAVWEQYLKRYDEPAQEVECAKEPIEESEESQSRSEALLRQIFGYTEEE